MHLGRLRDKSRKVLQIVEITGFEEGDIVTNVIYEFVEEGENPDGTIKGKLIKKGELINEEKLQAAGISI